MCVHALFVLYKVLDRLKQQVQTVLFSHEAYIDHQQRLPTFDLEPKRRAVEVRNVGAVAHNEDAVWMLSAPRDSNFLKGLVGGDGNVRNLEGTLLSEPRKRTEHPITFAELGLKKLRGQIVMIEDKTDAERFQKQSDQENGVRGIAPLEHSESRVSEYLQDEIELSNQSKDIFQ
jgi:hypothetical protein